MSETFVITDQKSPGLYLRRMSTRYGLVMPVWTTDQSRAKVWRTRAGMEAFLLAHPTQPFVGRPA